MHKSNLEVRMEFANKLTNLIGKNISAGILPLSDMVVDAAIEIYEKNVKKEALDFAEFIAQGNYEHSAAALPQQLTYWNEVDDPERHGEDGPESITNHQLYLLFKNGATK